MSKTFYLWLLLVALLFMQLQLSLAQSSEGEDSDDDKGEDHDDDDPLEDCLECIALGGKWYYKPTGIFEHDEGECSKDVEYENGTKIVEYEDDVQDYGYTEFVNTAAGCADQFDTLSPVEAGLVIGGSGLAALGLGAGVIFFLRRKQAAAAEVETKDVVAAEIDNLEAVPVAQTVDDKI